MKFIHSLSALAFIGTTLAIHLPRSKSKDYGDKEGWIPIWIDNFVKNKVHTVPMRNLWQFADGHAPGASEKNSNVTYRGDTTTLEISPDHTLQIIPRHAQNGTWTSGKVESLVSFITERGKLSRYEARIKVRDVPGEKLQGIWPRFYTLGEEYRGHEETWPAMGEIEIFQMMNGVPTFTPIVHCGEVSGGPCNEPGGHRPDQPGHLWIDFSKGDFHTFALEIDRRECAEYDDTLESGCWMSETMTWFFDGASIYSRTGANIGNKAAWEKLVHSKRFVGLAVTVAGDRVGPTNEKTIDGTGAAMEVDYVGVWNHCGEKDCPSAWKLLCAPWCLL